jgi:hypothetical protein
MRAAGKYEKGKNTGTVIQVHTFPAFHPKAPNDELHLAGLLTFLLSGPPSHSV